MVRCKVKVGNLGRITDHSGKSVIMQEHLVALPRELTFFLTNLFSTCCPARKRQETHRSETKFLKQFLPAPFFQNTNKYSFTIRTVITELGEIQMDYMRFTFQATISFLRKLL